MERLAETAEVIWACKYSRCGCVWVKHPHTHTPRSCINLVSEHASVCARRCVGAGEPICAQLCACVMYKWWQLVEWCDPSAVVTAAVSGAVSAHPDRLVSLHQTDCLVNAAGCPVAWRPHPRRGRRTEVATAKRRHAPQLQQMRVSEHTVRVTEMLTGNKISAGQIWLLKQFATKSLPCSWRKVCASYRGCEWDKQAWKMP